MTLLVPNKRRFIWERDKGCCWICGRAVPFEEMTLDHVVPKSKGGKNDVGNLRAAHGPCNNERGNGDPRPAKKHNKRKHKSKGRLKWEAGSEGYTKAGRPKTRGPVMAHITNENVKKVPKKILTTEERIALQKRDVP